MFFFRVITLTIFLSSFIFSFQTTLPKSKRLIEGELENGLKYTIMKNIKPKNRVELRLYIGVGSLEENESQRGLAHFIEHMAFNGTEHFKKNEMIKYFESIGMSFGSHLNAETSYEDTLYSLTVPLEKDNLEKSFLVLRDIASGILFDRDEFEKERGVILEEARVRNTVSYRLFQKSKRLIFGESRYKDRDPIGKREVIETAPVDYAKRFYKDWYRPEFMHLFVVGDIDEKRVESMIYKYFSSLQNRSTKRRFLRFIPENNTTRVLSVSDKELSYNYLKVSYLDKLENLRTLNDLKKALVEEMVLKLFNLKAKEQILKDNPKASSIYLSSDAINKNRGKYTFFVNFKDSSDAKLALEELYRLIFSFREFGFSKSDFEAVREDIILSNENELREDKNIYSSTIASWLVEYAKSNSIFMDKADEYRLKKSLIETITLEDVNRLFRDITNFKDRAILFATTNPNFKISKSEVLDIIEGAKLNVQNLNVEKKLPKKLLNTPLKRKKIVSVDFDREVGVYKIVLENGLEVYFKESNLSKNRVLLKGFSLGGYSLYGVDRLNSAKNSSLFINSSGVGEFSSIDLLKILANRDVFVNTDIQNYLEVVLGESSSKDIESMFELLYMQITQPVIDKRVEKNLKKILKADIENRKRVPFNRFFDEINIWYSNNNPRVIAKIDTPERIDRLNGEEMLEIYKDRFSDFNNFKFIIVGDTNLSVIEELVAKYLGNLPTKRRDENYTTHKIDYKSGKVFFYRDYNSENITNVNIVYRSNFSKFTLRDKFIINGIESILNVRLRNLIREDKSGVYGIGVNSQIDEFSADKNLLLTIGFSCNPKRADELIESIYREIDSLKRDGIKKEELNRFKKQFSLSYDISIKDNNFWIATLSRSLIFNRPLNIIYKIPTVVDSISKDDIDSMIDRVFGKNILEARLNPIVEESKKN